MKQLSLLNVPPNPQKQERAYIQSFEDVARNYARACINKALKSSEANDEALQFQRMCFETMLKLDKWQAQALG